MIKLTSMGPIHMKHVDPAVRQQRLLARSAELRLSLANQAQCLKKPLAVVDKARAGVQWLYRNPIWPLGAGLLGALIFPKRAMLRWGGRAWGAWSTFKRVRQLLEAKSRKHRTP